MGELLKSKQKTGKIPLFDSRQRGQAVVELVVILPLLLLLIVGALELGRVFFAKIVITNAAREGVYYLSLNASDQSGAKLAAEAEANNSGITLAAANIGITCTITNGACKSGDPVTVAVSQTLNNLFLISLFNGSKNSLTISSSAEMVVQ